MHFTWNFIWTGAIIHIDNAHDMNRVLAVAETPLYLFLMACIEYLISKTMCG
jgi:hypothetical protein